MTFESFDVDEIVDVNVRVNIAEWFVKKENLL